MAEINRRMGSTVLVPASHESLVVKYLPTGLLPVDVLCQGGLPRGRFVEVTGDFCLAPETLVLTADYVWQPMGSLRVGDEIIGFDEEPEPGRGQIRKYRRATVERTRHKQLPSFEIKTDQGTTTVASTNHLWLVRNNQNKPEWKKTCDLGAGDQILWFGKPWGAPSYQYEAAYLSGVYDGEGWVDSHARIQFGQNPGLVLDKVRMCLDQLGFKYIVQPQGSADVQRLALLGGMRERMRFMGQVRPERLASKLWYDGVGIASRGPNATFDGTARVTSIRYVGDQPVIAIGTSTQTLIADGMFTHNSTLKSYIGLNAIREVQQAGGIAAIVDTEHAFDPQWAESVGVRLDDLIQARPETGEAAIDAAEMLIRNGLDLLVFDSIAATMPKADADKSMSDTAQPGRLASLMSRGSRKMTTANARTACMFINQLRQNIGVTFGPTEQPTGGKAMGYYASYRFNIKKTGWVSTNEKSYDGEKWIDTKVRTAQKYRMLLEKSKLSKPLREIHFMWDLNTGTIDLTAFMIAQGLELGLITQSGPSWTFGTLKVQGKDNFKARVATDQDLANALEVSIRQEHGLYIPPSLKAAIKPKPITVAPAKRVMRRRATA
jgi:recombination protein RecA